jgi:hypothetical protein
MEFTWNFTVCSLMDKREAIHLLLRPSAINANTSCSRGVSDTVGSAGTGRWPIQRSIAAPSKANRPAATASDALDSCSAEQLARALQATGEGQHGHAFRRALEHALGRQIVLEVAHHQIDGFAPEVAGVVRPYFGDHADRRCGTQDCGKPTTDQCRLGHDSRRDDES